jgi:hypothetical protein
MHWANMNILSCTFVVAHNGTAENKYLKVVGNEKNAGSRKMPVVGNGLGLWRSRFIYSLNMQFLIKNLISFSALSSKMNK